MYYENVKWRYRIVPDVVNSPNPDEVYDTPALGEPRAAPPRALPARDVHIPDDLGVGSLVEVATDVDQHYYGVIRWLGVSEGESQIYKQLLKTHN